MENHFFKNLKLTNLWFRHLIWRQNILGNQIHNVSMIEKWLRLVKKEASALFGKFGALISIIISVGF